MLFQLKTFLLNFKVYDNFGIDDISQQHLSCFFYTEIGYEKAKFFFVFKLYLNE